LWGILFVIAAVIRNVIHNSNPKLDRKYLDFSNAAILEMFLLPIALLVGILFGAWIA